VSLYRVTYVGDLFVLSTHVEYEIVDDNEDNEDAIIALATEALADRYGWDVLSVATIDVEVEEVG
jgi:hypothetical protein